MNTFMDPTIKSKADLEALLNDMATRMSKRYLKAAAKNGASKDQLDALRCVCGIVEPAGILTDADLGEVIFRWQRLMAALFQVGAADQRICFSYRQYPVIGATLGDRKPYDLKGHKRALEPQLKKEFSDYVAKFAVDQDSDEPAIVVRVIGMKVMEATTVAGVRIRRTTKASSAFTAIEAAGPSSARRDIAGFAAAFWAPLAPPRPTSDLTARATARALAINCFVARSLMLTDRICFGHGPLGKAVTRSVLAEAKARAGSADILRKAPVQFEGIPAFLATLPTDKEGTPPALPAMRLP